ncbi:hypothetical protein ACH4LN_28250 [Streptomyces albus]|uniref:Uncharacterized protein n=1 Tax=Streptomyces albus TaxID=1888 RepID=A0A6C1C633_9ACTN|nr:MULTISPECIES: hypothetical protein [Streptomyces]EPD91100.1 hypothetical protein HMPREF1486_05487 [Streptomyces sp. HPH0547]QID36992.1 hypothetical protein G3260_003306 [Streptomyces albus]TGG88095.1 hypothetical protein D8771_04110 [Streptomyces albus]UVN56084.1 hypothetical protein NR995_17365 [Streptomyces albus]GHJ22807.1 hypothetical protein TPA0909_44210 [Streptomyces albus]
MTSVAFRCEAVASDLRGSREVVLGAYCGRSPRLAARWLNARARKLAHLLDPAPESAHLRDAPLVAVQHAPCPQAELRAWAESHRAYEQVMAALAQGRPFLLTVRDYDAEYALRVHPTPGRRPSQVPAARQRPAFR